MLPPPTLRTRPEEIPDNPATFTEGGWITFSVDWVNMFNYIRVMYAKCKENDAPATPAPPATPSADAAPEGAR